MAGNSGVYGKRRFERGGSGASPVLADGSIDRDEAEAELHTGRIIVQQTADSVTSYIDPVQYPITITKIGLIGKTLSTSGPTTTTTGTLTAALNLLDSNLIATTTIHDASISATTSNKIYNEETTGVNQAVAANEALSVTWGATSKVDDGASLCIQYTID